MPLERVSLRWCIMTFLGKRLTTLLTWSRDIFVTVMPLAHSFECFFSFFCFICVYLCTSCTSSIINKWWRHQVTANKPVSVQCFDTVVWVTGRASGLKKTCRTYLPQVLLCNSYNKKAEWEPTNVVICWKTAEKTEATEKCRDFLDVLDFRTLQNFHSLLSYKTDD